MQQGKFYALVPMIAYRIKDLLVFAGGYHQGDQRESLIGDLEIVVDEAVKRSLRQSCLDRRSDGMAHSVFVASLDKPFPRIRAIEVHAEKAAGRCRPHFASRIGTSENDRLEYRFMIKVGQNRNRFGPQV